MPRNQVFISYSHRDKKWRDEFTTNLKPYLRDHPITSWSDQQIAPGSEWFNEIKSALENSKIAILLVSPDFFASDFIHAHEFGPLLKKAEQGGVTILWIPVRASSYEQTALKSYQALHDPGQPLADMSKAKRDRAWLQICKEFENAVKKGRRPSYEDSDSYGSHIYKCLPSETAAKKKGLFKRFANNSSTAWYLVLRGRDIVGKNGEIRRPEGKTHVCHDVGSKLLEVRLLMVDFESMEQTTFDQLTKNTDLVYQDLDTEKSQAKDRLEYVKHLSDEIGLECRLLPANMIPEMKLRLYDGCGFFSFYWKIGGGRPMQKRPVFCVCDDPSRQERSPLLKTLEQVHRRLWDMSRPL